MISHEFGHALSYDHQLRGVKSIMIQGQITSNLYPKFFNMPQSLDKSNWKDRFHSLYWIF